MNIDKIGTKNHPVLPLSVSKRADKLGEMHFRGAWPDRNVSFSNYCFRNVFFKQADKLEEMHFLLYELAAENTQLGKPSFSERADPRGTHFPLQLMNILNDVRHRIRRPPTFNEAGSREPIVWLLPAHNRRSGL